MKIEQTLSLKRFRGAAKDHVPLPPLDVRNVNRGWAIYDRTGQRVSGLHGSRDLALDSAERLERAMRRTERRCIGHTLDGDRCGAVFLSDGPHHRMCDYCRRRG